MQLQVEVAQAGVQPHVALLLHELVAQLVLVDGGYEETPELPACPGLGTQGKGGHRGPTRGEEEGAGGRWALTSQDQQRWALGPGWGCPPPRHKPTFERAHPRLTTGELLLASPQNRGRQGGHLCLAATDKERSQALPASCVVSGTMAVDVKEALTLPVE